MAARTGRDSARISCQLSPSAKPSSRWALVAASAGRMAVSIVRYSFTTVWCHRLYWRAATCATLCTRSAARTNSKVSSHSRRWVGDDGRFHSTSSLARSTGIGHSREGDLESLTDLLHRRLDRVDQAFLQRGVVVEQQRGGDPGGRGDVARRGEIEAVLDDGVLGGLANSGLARWATGGAARTLESGWPCVILIERSVSSIGAHAPSMEGRFDGVTREEHAARARLPRRRGVRSRARADLRPQLVLRRPSRGPGRSRRLPDGGRRRRERDRGAHQGRRAARLLQRLPAPRLAALRREHRAA